MAFGLFSKLKKKPKDGKGKRKDATKNEDVVKDKEKQPSLESASGKKLQGNSHQSCHNSKEQTNALEAGSSHSKMVHSLDHPGSPECTSASPGPRSQSVETTDKRSESDQKEPVQPLGPSKTGQVFPNSDKKNGKGHQYTCTRSGDHHAEVPAAKVELVRPVNNKMDAPKTDSCSSEGGNCSRISAPKIQEQPVVTVSRDAAATAATSTCTPTAHFPKLVNSSLSQASTAASPTVMSAPANEPENPVNGENTLDDVQPADRPPLPANQGSPPDANGAAAANSVNTDTTAAQLAAASSPSTTDGVSQNSVDPEDAASERSVNTNSEQQQSLPAFPIQVEPEPTADQETTVTVVEETPQQEETINYENFLVSEKINGNTFIQDKLSVNLDRTSHRVIKNWEHLACTNEINAPLKVRLKCKMVGENSRTMMLIEVLTSEFEDKTVKDVVDALTRMTRNDVIKIITDVYPDATDSTEKFSDFVACLENSELIENIATLLDQKSTVNKNWLHLGLQFKLSNETLKEIEYGPINPTEVLMKYMYSRKTDLTIGEFYDEVKKLKRHDVLKKLDFFIAEASDRGKPMKNVIGLESDAMRSICVCLNNPNRAIKNWRHLCKSRALGIPEDVYKDCEPEKQRSPTDLLFEWIFGNKVDLTVGQLCSALAKIDRNDIVRDLREYFEQNSSGHLGQV